MVQLCCGPLLKVQISQWHDNTSKIYHGSSKKRYPKGISSSQGSFSAGLNLSSPSIVSSSMKSILNWTLLGVGAVGGIPIIPMICNTVSRKTTFINGIEPLTWPKQSSSRKGHIVRVWRDVENQPPRWREVEAPLTWNEILHDQTKLVS